jgi:ketosteroid isomerase-like protein
VKDVFAAIGRGDVQALLALSAEDIEWITPGEWALAGTRRGHAGLADLLQLQSEAMETSFPEPLEFVAQGDRVLVVGFSTGKVKATNRTFADHFVIAITVNTRLQGLALCANHSESHRAYVHDPQRAMPATTGEGLSPRNNSTYWRSNTDRIAHQRPHVSMFASSQ